MTPTEDPIARARAAAEGGRADALAALEAELARLDPIAARLGEIARLALLPAGIADRARRLSLDIWSGVNGATVLLDRARGG